jgi:hypothetical protein
LDMALASVGITEVKRENTTVNEADKMANDICTSTSKNPVPYLSLSTIGGLFFHDIHRCAPQFYSK